MRPPALAKTRLNKLEYGFFSIGGPPMFEFIPVQNAGVLPVQNLVQHSVLPTDYLTPMVIGSDPGPYPPPQRLSLLQNSVSLNDYLTPMVVLTDPGPFPPPQR
jgi:hypothetical protein